MTRLQPWQQLLSGLLLGLLLLSPAWAQTPEASPIPLPLATPTPRPTPPPTLNPDTISDEEINNLVQALQKIQPLVEKASRDLQATAEPDKRQQIESEFETTATRVVRDHNLTPERYRDLITLANNNPAFRRRVQARLDALRPPSPSPSPQEIP